MGKHTNTRGLARIYFLPPFNWEGHLDRYRGIITNVKARPGSFMVATPQKLWTLKASHSTLGLSIINLYCLTFIFIFSAKHTPDFLVRNHFSVSLYPWSFFHRSDLSSPGYSICLPTYPWVQWLVQGWGMLSAIKTQGDIVENEQLSFQKNIWKK